MLSLLSSITAVLLAAMSAIPTDAAHQEEGVRPAALTGVSHERLIVAPGATTLAHPMVRNVGRTPIDHVVLYLSIPPPLYAGSFRNCVANTALICAFDTVLQPGETYRLSRPLPLRAPRNAAAGSRIDPAGRWLTTTGFDHWQAENGQRARPTLALIPLPGSPALTGSKPADSRADVTLTVAGAQRPDLAAVGATLTAAIGDTLTATLGARNLGPGTLLPTLFPNNRLPVTVTLSKGLEVRRVDKHCHRLRTSVYRCHPAATKIRPGESTLFTFTLEVTAHPGSATVAVDADRNPANDKATLTIERPGGSSPNGFTPDKTKQPASVRLEAVYVLVMGRVHAPGPGPCADRR